MTERLNELKLSLLRVTAMKYGFKVIAVNH